MTYSGFVFFSKCVFQFDGKPIKWSHLVSVVEEGTLETGQLRYTHKLTPNHIHLTPALRMKVRYAAQVCHRF